MHATSKIIPKAKKEPTKHKSTRMESQRNDQVIIEIDDDLIEIEQMRAKQSFFTKHKDKVIKALFLTTLALTAGFALISTLDYLKSAKTANRELQAQRRRPRRAVNFWGWLFGCGAEQPLPEDERASVNAAYWAGHRIARGDAHRNERTLLTLDFAGHCHYPLFMSENADIQGSLRRLIRESLCSKEAWLLAILNYMEIEAQIKLPADTVEAQKEKYYYFWVSLILSAKSVDDEHLRISDHAKEIHWLRVKLIQVERKFLQLLDFNVSSPEKRSRLQQYWGGPGQWYDFESQSRSTECCPKVHTELRLRGERCPHC